MKGFSLLRFRECSVKILFESKKCQYSNTAKNKLRDVLKLHERGMYQELFPDTSVNYVSKILNESPQCVYAGFDPTAESLHIGNLLVLMNLLHWHRGGHKVIAVVGGATGLIGDPSHRTNERIPLELETLKRNTNSIKDNITTIFDNFNKYFYKDTSSPLIPVTILNNIEWYEHLNIIDFMNKIGKHFRIGTMMGRTSVQDRLKSNTGMSYSEFAYQVFQAYDWMYLLNNYGCRFQIGGHDQMGNIMSGHELISRTSKKDVFGFTLPLITSEGGKKFGKSLNNAVYLSSSKTPCFDLYQFFVRTKDTEVESYLKLFTFLTLKEIKSIMEEHRRVPEKRRAQQILADNVTLLVHGDDELIAAQNTTALLYDKSELSLSSMTQDQVALAFEGSNIMDLVVDESMTVLELSLKARCFKTAKDAFRIICAGGFYINYDRITNPDIVVDRKHILPNNITLIRTGKRRYHVIRWMQMNKVENKN